MLLRSKSCLDLLLAMKILFLRSINTAGGEDPFPLIIKPNKGGQSQIIIDITDFENGMNGWEFKSWMPKTRETSAAIVSVDGLRSKHVLQFDADGRDDDGIFFIQKSYKADIEGPWKQAWILERGATVL